MTHFNTQRDQSSAPISPAMHAVLDYTVAAGFFGLAAALRGRHQRASTLALLNGAMVAGMSMLTDYPGGMYPLLSFRDHRAGDILQAAVTGLGPALMGFAGDEEARYFYGQAAMEAAVIKATDWDGVDGTRSLAA